MGTLSTISNVPGVTNDPQWYRTAVFYEVMVRSFVDSNGDGSGDLQGLISKLDYLQWLGIDALWLPPFFSSPLRDGGYDVADYRSVLPEFGTIEDFCDLIAKAHERGMRIVIDLVLNHTSDQHEWFQRSRSEPDGPYGDFYVWNGDDTKYPNIRLIFPDYEDSNWEFDSVRRQFYFHRFFAHQPDLNYDNPAVRKEILDIVRFWLDAGVDGFRLDAVPYLYESDEGNGESEPPTHEFLKELRRMLDLEYPGRVLIAEANQPPRETARYFGTDEEPECHMAFDFPVMPHIFHALRSQETEGLSGALSHGTQLPAGAGWGVFLRNHDELTLEMVSEEHRHAMYGWYAYDPRMRVNVGIRRRLAPLLDNSRRELELVHALLFSLPGSPFLYYGDEIGMGDNIWLPDRDSSRTPMQWTADRNAGFSTADSGKLYLPVVQSLAYHYMHTNVETQLAHSSSLLHWVRDLISVRRVHPSFGLGSIELLNTSDPSVLAFTREWVSDDPSRTSETILCVFSFAQSPVSVQIDLTGVNVSGVSDIFGGRRFAGPAADGGLTVTLAPQSFYWLAIEKAAVETGSSFSELLVVA